MEVYAETSVNEDTQSLLNLWFKYRRICTSSVDKFLDFWHRNLNDYYDAYLLKLELELTEIPEFTNYAEALHNVLTDKGTSASAHTGTQTKAKSGNDKNEKTGNEKLDRIGDETMNNTGTDTMVNTGTDTVQNTGTQTNAQTVDATHKEVALQGPQSQSYPNTVAGSMPSLDWGYISGQGQTSDNAGTNQRTDNLTATETLNTQNQETLNTQNKKTIDTLDTVTYNTEDKKTYNSQDQTTFADTNTRTDNLAHTTDTQKSGRTELETEIREKISRYIGRSIALDWFKDKLEICFFGIYED